MAVLQWTPDLNTGISEIDQQHRRICEYINRLDRVLATHDRSELGAVIEGVVEYTMSHFSYEESLMEDAGYGFVNAHRRVHKMVVKRINDLRERYKKGEDVAAELHDMLSRWLFSHIRSEDRAYLGAVKVFLSKNSDWDAAQRAKMEAEQGSEGGWINRIFGDIPDDANLR